MTSKAQPIGGYVFKSTDELLLDTNVWLSVYGPRKPGSAKAAVYSQALASMLKAQSRIFIDVLIVSEFVNAYARLRYNILRSKGTASSDFKQFRRSVAFKPIAKDIAGDVKQVLKHCVRVDSGFSTLDIQALIAEYEQGDSDLNDQVLAELCKSKGLKLVTDDGDFGGHGLALVTANKRLLGP
ncbi:MAG: PIN domain-containing protein [Deltaproteobacteria bacterium]|nr:PIN domain-containing protein [Deltaproteobacteria bacterium]